MILPLPKMDLKYRKLLVQSALETEIDEPDVFKPGEDSFVHRWRTSTFQDRFIKEGDSELKSTLEDLRTRETELQIILLLEILALDKEHPPNDISEPTKGKRKSKIKSKKVKPTEGAPNPDMLLDLLVDRLCIWHSLGSGEGETPDKGREGVSAKDHLRHFSVEVITAL
jgi:DNA replication regulator SLD3